MCSLNLSYNNIGSRGASLISLGLASNPTLKWLHLNDNCITDGDTYLIAESLKRNTHLRGLDLFSNPITLDGTVELLKASFDQRSLNILHDCNQGCTINTDWWDKLSGSVDVAKAGSLIEVFSREYRGFYDDFCRVSRRKAKVFFALRENIGHLENIPLNLVPHILHFVQVGGLCLQELPGIELDFTFDTLYEVLCSLAGRSMVFGV